MSKFGALGAVLAAGAALALAAPAAATVTGPTAVSQPSPFDVGCAGPGHDSTGTLFEDGEVEPWASVNQNDTSQVAGAWQQDRWSDGGSHGLVSTVSTDGGSTFGGDVFPDFSRCPLFAHYGDPDAQAPGNEFDRGSDPWVSWGSAGRLHQVALTVSEPEFGLGLNSGILVSHSDDQGANWSHPQTLKEDTARGGTVLNDKESITADPNNGHVYVIWDRLVSPSEHSSLQSVENALGFHGPTWFSRSLDNGDTWSPARIIYNPGQENQTIANQIAVGDNGELIDVFLNIQNFSNRHHQRGIHVAVMRSSDNGATWSKPTFISNLVDQTVRTPDGKRLRTGDLIPDIAVDPKTPSTVYVAWQDARSGTPAIWLAKSTDDGKSWGTPQQVSDTPTGPAFTGSVDVNTDGVVGVTYYDFRMDNDNNDATALTDYWFRSSSDGGGSWSDDQRVTQDGSFNMKDAPVARGYFVGDYEGLDHAGTAFKPFFVEAQPSTDNPTDVYTATVTP